MPAAARIKAFQKKTAKSETVYTKPLTPPDTTLKVWDLATGQPIATFHCDAPATSCACADNHRIIAGDEGGRVYILSLEENFPSPSH
jgi:hypothetical protein